MLHTDGFSLQVPAATAACARSVLFSVIRFPPRPSFSSSTVGFIAARFEHSFKT